MFRFRLQQVLELREKQEQSRASQLVNALGAEREAQRALTDLRAVRESGTDSAHTTTRSVGELANFAFIMERIDGQIADASEAVDAAGEIVSQAQSALNEAFKDRRVLDRLRERHAENYRATTEQTDRRHMDDIALSRYVQNED